MTSGYGSVAIGDIVRVRDGRRQWRVIDTHDQLAKIEPIGKPGRGRNWQPMADLDVIQAGEACS